MTSVDRDHEDGADERAREADARLVARVLAGDAAAFEAVMRANNQRLFRMTRALLGDDAEAEDAMQQAYLSAYTHLATFAGESALSTWLVRIARNEALSRLRTRKRRAESPLVDEDPEHAEETTMPARARAARTPEELAALGQLTAIVERAVDALPEIYRVVFVLREVELLDTETTAASLEISEGLVKVRLHRARQMLREALLDDLDASTPRAFVFLGERCDRVVGRVLAAWRPPS